MIRKMNSSDIPIKSPTDIDHYTDEDISNMIEYLDYNGVATFPLQMIINIINHLGGQHFWHEVNSYEDMDAYYEQRNAGGNERMWV